jgi:tRNA-guanine family transglycosylase
MTGPPPLDRNGGIWKKIKADLSKTVKKPKIMVQAFHFTAYGLSDGAWQSWIGDSPLSLSKETDRFFKNGSIFVDSGGYQFLQGDKVDLSKWGVEANQEGIYKLQSEYGANKICNLDIPISPYDSREDFQKKLYLNLNNIKKLLDISKENTKEIYLVIHGRNRVEIEYFYNKLKENVDISDERINFALGSQVPLTSQRNLVIDNANYTITLIKNDFGGEKSVHFFGIGSQVVRRVEDRIKYSYDNSTYARAAMYHKWYDKQTNSYQSFNPKALKGCSCYACKKLKEIEANEIINIFLNKATTDEYTKSDIMAYIALHNIYQEKNRIKAVDYSPTTMGSISFSTRKQIKKEYTFPLSKFKSRGHILLILECSSKKPYSKSNSHRKIKNEIRENYNIQENLDFDVITMSGLFGPVHWKDEMRPEILSYDFRLTNMTSEKHIYNLRMKTVTVMEVVRKKYEYSYALINGLYYKTFAPILEEFDTHVGTKLSDLEFKK